MVHPQAAGIGQGAVHHLDEGSEISLHDRLRIERRQTPALALGVVRVGRGADLEVEVQ
ncbi:hypothetical protein SDC9_134515 [bioreactor metagenome]|uniref:Uncharacterized protein n=1 Tax=bioreactor metagenome TaxID=1076179 RepID=A0A645DDU4_9ZZZZ